MKLGIYVATMKEPNRVSLPGDMDSVTDHMYDAYKSEFYVRYNTVKDNLGVVGSYQYLYEKSDADVLAFIHDDVIISEHGWNARVMAEFEDPTVGVVGFGGALWHGTPDLYKVPYKLQNLRRGEYLSNVGDAEVHGERFTGSCDVAVLDGFCLIVRRSLLDVIGGWSVLARGCDFFCYDYALCAYARRYGYRVRCVGVSCHHRGGGTSVGGNVKEITSPEAYDSSHRWFYEEFRDVMPYDVRHEKTNGLLHNATESIPSR